MAPGKTAHDNPDRRKPDAVTLPFFRAWQRAIGMPIWRIMAASDLSDATIYSAQNGRPISRATARLFAIALEIPLDFLLHISPDHEDAREVVRLRAAEVRDELAAHDARLDMRRLVFVRNSAEYAARRFRPEEQDGAPVQDGGMAVTS
jgi:hypothetical protein